MSDKKSKWNEEEDKAVRRNAMSLFGINANKLDKSERFNPEEMIKNLKLTGSTDLKNATAIPIIGKNQNHILNLSSGRPKIQTNVINRFKLIMVKPEELEALNNYEIRCALCNKVISYPCWYYKIEYAVNHFHYFVCMSDKTVNANCYKRSV